MMASEKVFIYCLTVFDHTLDILYAFTHAQIPCVIAQQTRAGGFFLRSGATFAVILLIIELIPLCLVYEDFYLSLGFTFYSTIKHVDGTKIPVLSFIKDD